MKNNNLICLLTCLALVLSAFGIHSVTKTEEKKIKVGFIFVGDEITPYTYNFIKARDSVIEKYGDRIDCVTLYNVTEDKIAGPLQDLVDQKCDYIIAPSYGYGPCVKEMAEKHPEIQFCVPTGDNANAEPVLPNYHNCFATIYQGRYVCGVVAGLKLREMIDQGFITPEQAKIGYVAAFPFSEVISGYTSFFLGVKSIVPEATMLVKYTDTWSSYSIEKQVATELIDQDCVIISQHSDTTGPAIACEMALTPVYHVGYNQSMTDVAPTRSLVSCTVDYSYYFQQSVSALLNGKKIEDCIDGETIGQDAMAGFDKGWVRVLDLNETVLPENAKKIVEEKIEQLEEGEIEVFHGDFTGVSVFDETDTIDLSKPYQENKNSSSPTFCYLLDDVITVIP